MTTITEVTARTGHRKWVYGPLDPARPIEIKPMNPPAPAEAVAEIQAFMDQQLAILRGKLMDVWTRNGSESREINAVESSTLSVDRHRTAAEYRSQGIW